MKLFFWMSLILFLLFVGFVFAFECPNGEVPLGVTIQTCPSVYKDENGDCDRGGTDGMMVSVEHLPGRAPTFKWGDLRHKCDFDLEMLALYEIDSDGNFVSGSLTDLAQLNWTICAPSSNGQIISVDIHGGGLDNMTIDIEISLIKSPHSRFFNFTFELDQYTFTYGVAEDIVLAAIFESDDDYDDDGDHGHGHGHKGDEGQETRMIEENQPHPPHPPPQQPPPPHHHPSPPHHPPPPPPPPHHPPPPPPPHHPPHPHPLHDCSIEDSIFSAEEIARYTYLPTEGGSEVTADVDVTSSTSNNGETGFFLIFGTGEYNGTFVSLTFEAILQTGKAAEIKASSAGFLSPSYWIGGILLLTNMIIIILS